MGKEVLQPKNDEVLVAKLADYIEAANYKVYVGHFRVEDKKFNLEKLNGFARKIKDKTAKKLVQQFIGDWLKSVDKNDYIKILSHG